MELQIHGGTLKIYLQIKPVACLRKFMQIDFYQAEHIKCHPAICEFDSNLHCTQSQETCKFSSIFFNHNRKPIPRNLLDQRGNIGSSEL
jgi:hypothetical protein